ncbi:MAG: nucleotidyltransferase family protein [Candidatus Acidiferrales bacterium]
MLAAVILAGGESRRMGAPKALVPFQGRPFLEHLLQITRHPRIGVRRVVLGAHAVAISHRLPLEPHEVVINEEWEKGQLSSLHAAIHSLPCGPECAGKATRGMLVCLVDHPLVSAELVDALIRAFYTTRKLIAVPTYRGKRGHPVIFSSQLYEELLAAPLEVGARAVLWAHKADVVEVHTEEEGVVLNLNDPEALSKVTEIS